MRRLEIINSKDNKLLKHSRKLKIKKGRQESREFMIEGVRFVEEAVTSGAEIKYCLCAENLDGDRIESLLKTLKEKGVKLYEVESKLMKDIWDTETPQGILAVVGKKDNDIDGVIENSSFLILADRIQDPGNLGTLIRTADAAGAQGVIISEGTVDPYSPKVLRSTMGSIFHLPVIHVPNMVEAVDKLKSYGFNIYASSLEGSTPYYSEDYRKKTAVVIGNEASGIDGSIIQAADRLIKIPMPGNAESLNAGVAGGILMFEVVRQRERIDK